VGLSAGQRLILVGNSIGLCPDGETSYEARAALLRDLGHSADDSTLHALGQRVGPTAQEQTQKRLSQTGHRTGPQRGASRFRRFDAGWLAGTATAPGLGEAEDGQTPRRMHECKTGVFLLQERAARKRAGYADGQSGGYWQGGGIELGRRLHLAGVRTWVKPSPPSAGRSRRGSVIWNVQRPLGRGGGVLDFLSCSEHIWALGEAVYGQRERRPLVKRNCINYGTERQAAVLATIAGPQRARCGGKIIRREQNYFADMPPHEHLPCPGGWQLVQSSEPACLHGKDV